jgi:hypothetical protein
MPVPSIYRSLRRPEIKHLQRRFGASLNAALTIITVSAAKLKRVVGKRRTKLIESRGQRA